MHRSKLLSYLFFDCVFQNHHSLWLGFCSLTFICFIIYALPRHLTSQSFKTTLTLTLFYIFVLPFNRMPKRKASDAFNRVSAYEEEVEVEGLTLWDLNRPLWKAVQKSDNVEDLNLKALSFSEFKVRHQDFSRVTSFIVSVIFVNVQPSFFLISSSLVLLLFCGKLSLCFLSFHNHHILLYDENVFWT